MPGSLLESNDQINKEEQLTSSSKSELDSYRLSSRSSVLQSSPSYTVNLNNNNNSTNNYNRHQGNNNNQLISSSRSDRSDGSNCDSEGGGSTSTSTSNKKVSFNKAVRVKKYSTPPTHYYHSGDLSESKFWFKVHKADHCDHLNTVNNQLNQQQQLTSLDPSIQLQQRHQHSPSEHHLIQSLPSEGKLDEFSLLSPLVDSIINSSQLCNLNSKGLLSTTTTNCDHHCVNSVVDGNQPNNSIESDFKSLTSTSPLTNKPTSGGDLNTTTTTTTTIMPPISNSSRKDGVKIIDYSIDDQPFNGNGVTKMSTTTPKGTSIDDHSLKCSTGGKSTQRIINYEPYKSASTIALDIDSALRPRSPSPINKNGRHSSIDNVSRTIDSCLGNTVTTVTTTVTTPPQPGDVASEEIIETKMVEKKNPLLSGVKVMFGVKAKRAPTFPTMPNRSKSVDRTNNSTIKSPPSTNKTTATIVRPTFASKTTSSALKSRDSPITNSSTLRSRQSELTNPTLKSSLTSSRNPPLTSSLKKTPAPATPIKSVRDVSTSRVSTKSPSSLVSSEINKLMSTVSTTKKPTTTSTTKTTPTTTNSINEVISKKVSSTDHKGEDNVDSVGNIVEMARERPADQSTGDLIPVSTWNSGPVLISNVANKETSSSYIPGEGKLMASLEEGTKIWKSKTRRVYEEPIKIPREESISPERRRDGSTSPERLSAKSKSKSSDKQSSSSRTHSPDRYHHHRHQQSRDRSPERMSPTRNRPLSPKSSGHYVRSDSPERSPSSAGYRSPTRSHRSPSPIIIERQSPALTPITVDINDDAIDGIGLKKSNRTRFSPEHETFYRSSSSIGDNHHKSLPTGDDLDEIFLRKDIYPNNRQPNHRDETDLGDSLIVDYTPKMEDKACQCNLKRSSKSRGGQGETDSLSGLNYRVIKPANDGSVSTFSNVPDISDAETELDRRSNRPISRDGSPVIVDRRSPINHHHHHHPEVIYSQIDRTKKRSPNQPSPLPSHQDDDHYHQNLDQPGEYGPDDYLYESNAIKSARSSISPNRAGDTRRSMETSSYRHQSPSPSPSRRYMFEVDRKQESPSRPNKTVSVTHKTYGFNMKTALDAPEVHLPTRPPSTKPVRIVDPPYHHHEPHPYHPHDEIMSRSTGGRLESHQQTRMMRDDNISNLSGDELINRRGSLSDPDDLIAPKSIIREIDHRKGEINYENVTPRNRSTGIRGSIYEDGQSTNNSMWFRSLEDDYRKGLSERESFNNNVNHHPHHPHQFNHHESSNHNVTDYCTMSRRGRDRLPSSRDVGADYPPPSTMTHAYTLDRRHLDRAKRSKRPGPGYSTSGSHLGISSPTMSMSMNGNGGLTSSAINNNNSSPSMAMRKYNSTRDLSHLHSQPDFMEIGSNRGGLAAAYKARQRRASSLSRFGQSPNPVGYHLPISPSSNLYPRTSHSVLSSSNYPLHSGSHSQLHRLHLTGGSEIGGYHPHHHYHPGHHHPLRSSASHIGASYGHSSSESDAGLGIHQRTLGGSRSRLTHHQNDPVVLYIPAISHHHRPVDEDDRNSALGIARTQSILSTSKRSVKNGSSKEKTKRDQSKDRDDNFNEITSRVNGYLNNNNSNSKTNNQKNPITSTGLINDGDGGDDDEIIELRDEEDTNNNKINGKKKDVKRSVSIPKDTKLPWLQKLKMKVKS